MRITVSSLSRTAMIECLKEIVSTPDILKAFLNDSERLCLIDFVISFVESTANCTVGRTITLQCSVFPAASTESPDFVRVGIVALSVSWSKGDGHLVTCSWHRWSRNLLLILLDTLQRSSLLPSDSEDDIQNLLVCLGGPVSELA